MELHDKNGNIIGYHFEPDPETSEAVSEWLEESMYPRNVWHDYLGIGLHHQHVIDYHVRYSAKGQLLDMTFYHQIYAVPLLRPRSSNGSTS